MRLSAQPDELELWSGFECTINRVAGKYFDQTERNGHRNRRDDMERLAAMGVRKVRFPVLWESVAPNGLDSANFEFCDHGLHRLRDLGISPIVGLMHHGSGPPGNTLDCADFVHGLARFARLVAERYPWVEYFTPVNEPLTTARFCGLYGHWYPHGRDTQTFLRLLMAETMATVHAMRAIREVIPNAKLMQTEDFGRTFSTPPLAYQRDYENERRWLSIDLLCGKVDREHALWEHLVEMGIADSELDELAKAPCPPDIIGIDYYLTSDRFLDHRVERYPAQASGGNEYEPYVDVEAVRVYGRGIVGHENVIFETWERYKLPVAIAEVHVGCTREEQLRWLYAAWVAASRNRERGVDVRAVTVWAAFGSTDWNVLLTKETGHYESGAYDVRGTTPRSTALVRLARELSSGAIPNHPVLRERGWWQTNARFTYVPYGPVARQAGAQSSEAILVMGSGVLACAVLRACRGRGMAVRQVNAHSEALSEVESGRAWAVVVEPCFGEVPTDSQSQVSNVARLANACRRRKTPFLVFTNSLVFDGRAMSPYVEADAPNPACSVGKLLCWFERAALREFERTLVVRTGELLDPGNQSCPLGCILRAFARSDGVELKLGELISPAYLPHVADVSLDLLLDGEEGIWHLSNGGVLSWSELATTAIRNAVPCGGPGDVNIALQAQPRMRALASSRGQLMPTLDKALNSYLLEYESARGLAGPLPDLQWKQTGGIVASEMELG